MCKYIPLISNWQESVWWKPSLLCLSFLSFVCVLFVFSSFFRSFATSVNFRLISLNISLWYLFPLIVFLYTSRVKTWYLSKRNNYINGTYFTALYILTVVHHCCLYLLYIMCIPIISISSVIRFAKMCLSKNHLQVLNIRWTNTKSTFV